MVKLKKKTLLTPCKLPRVNEIRNILANFVYIETNKIKSNESTTSCNMVLEIFIMWGCNNDNLEKILEYFI
jgi:hypothetical protein